MFDKLLNYCQYLLYNYPKASEALSYIDSRLPREYQKQYNFGYFPSLDDLPMLFSEVPEQELLDNKLLYVKDISSNIGIYRSYISYFNDHQLIMSYKDSYGDIIGIVGRSLLSDDGRQELKISKYKNTTFKKSNNLFGLYEAKKHIIEKDNVYVVEGQFDVIKSHENGLHNIVALGCSDMSGYQLSLLLRYTNNITILLDNDEGGEKGRKKINNKFKEHANIIQAYLPKGYKDVDEFWSENKELYILH